MLIPSEHYGVTTCTASLSRGMNANSQHGVVELGLGGQVYQEG